jgi:predicted nucleic acid-binding protein
VAERIARGVLDTSVYIDLNVLDPADLPAIPEITAVTLAELHQGVAMAKSPTDRAARAEQLAAAAADFEPLPFGGAAAARYGSLVAHTLGIGRDPRPRTMDLMIAAVASAHGLPLFTRNPKDFRGLEAAVAIFGL